MIVTAIQRGDNVVVYTARNQILFTVGGTLLGYTGSSVTLRRGDWIYTYDERRQIIGTQQGRRDFGR